MTAAPRTVGRAKRVEMSDDRWISQVAVRLTDRGHEYLLDSVGVRWLP
jgi:hypothetical protein